MKVLLINGSPHINGNTSIALDTMAKVFAAESIDVEVVNLGVKDVRGCIACGACGKIGKCAFKDAVNDAALKFEGADGIVVAAPVYYASPNGSVISFLDRLFHSTPFDKTMKVGASVAVARRAGTTASLDVINKYFSISGMVTAGSQYWDNVFGGKPGEVVYDAEGLQTLRVLARNMSFLMRSIALGKDTFGLPEPEMHIKTNFIRK